MEPTEVIITAYNDLVGFFETNLSKHCEKPEELIDELINNQVFWKRTLIKGLLRAYEPASAEMTKVKKHLEKLKASDSEFAKLCTLRNSERRAERLANIVLDQMFNTPGVPTVDFYKSIYEDLKRKGFKASGGRRRSTRKASKRKSKTYRRRR